MSDISNKTKGFTLIELLVVMGMFMIVMVIASSAFERILSTSGQQVKAAESNIQGIVGLEMLRYDLDHAGYGLPFRFDKTNPLVGYEEVTNGLLARGMNAVSFNAANHDDIQAIAAAACTREVNDTAVTNARGGPDYLVIRSTVAGLDATSRKWAYVSYSTNGSNNLSYLKPWGNEEDFAPNDRIVAIRSTYSSNGTENKTLLMDDTTFQIPLGNPVALTNDSFKPKDASDEVVAYGIAAANLRMPYNRTDIYVSNITGAGIPPIPPKCNSGTGVLYKAVADHAGGFVRHPLLDCVGDMQVEFETDSSGTANTGSTGFFPTVSDLGAAGIRAQLRTIRVYLLAHDGMKDRNFRYPADTIQVGDPARTESSGRTLSSDDMASLFGADWRNYRWKVYTIATRARNLGQ